MFDFAKISGIKLYLPFPERGASSIGVANLKVNGQPCGLLGYIKARLRTLPASHLFPFHPHVCCLLLFSLSLRFGHRFLATSFWVTGAVDAPGPSETLDLVNFASLLSSYCLPLVSLSLSAVSPLSLTSLYLGSYLSATTCATSRSFRRMLAFKFPSRPLATALGQYH